jgi:hypothetical protein
VGIRLASNSINKSHIYKVEIVNSSTEDDDNDDNDDDVLDSIVIPTIPKLPTLTIQTVGQLTPSKRSHTEAILYACKQTDKPTQDQNKTLWIVENMRLYPFSIINTQGIEQNALAHEYVINHLVANGSEPLSCTRVVPSKRKLLDDTDCSCHKSNQSATHLPNIVYSSPYRNIFSKRKTSN